MTNEESLCTFLPVFFRFHFLVTFLKHTISLAIEMLLQIALPEVTPERNENLFSLVRTLTHGTTDYWDCLTGVEIKEDPSFLFLTVRAWRTDQLQLDSSLSFSLFLSVSSSFSVSLAFTHARTRLEVKPTNRLLLRNGQQFLSLVERRRRRKTCFYSAD